jgi:hypothetical protein
MPIKLGGLEIASTGDLVVGGAAYAVGFAVDAFFFPGGASSPEVAGATAIAGLAIKYAVHGAIRYSRRRRDNGEHGPGSRAL